MAVPVAQTPGTESRVAGDVTLVPAFNSPSAGDVCVLSVTHIAGATQYGASYTFPGDWTLALALDNGTTHRQWVYYKVATGSEGTGTISITVTGGSAASFHRAIIYWFTGAAGVEGITTQEAGAGTGVTDADVTTLGVDRLACQIGCMGGNVAHVNFTTETGVDWTIFNTSAANGPRLCLQTGSVAAASTVGGGSFTKGSAGAWLYMGLAITSPAAGRAKFMHHYSMMAGN